MMANPLLSIVMPAHQAAHQLPDSLAALAASDLSRNLWELIVVDDASTDATAAIAEQYADHLISLPAPPGGPGKARNRGAVLGSGTWLVFLDADVCVHPVTLRRITETISAHPELGAVFGSYDANPRAPGLISGYRNLLHRYVHLQGAGPADTFWAGCGAVRRDWFDRVRGFDVDRYPRPSIEDIDLGYRLRDLGARIVLDPRIEATHLKQWTLFSILKTDIFARGIPWMRLLLRRRGRSARSLNTSGPEPFKVVIAGLGLMALGLGAGLLDGRLLSLSAIAVAVLTILNLSVYRWFARERGVGFAVAVVPLHLIHYAGNAVAAAVGIGLHLLERSRRWQERGRLRDRISATAVEDSTQGEEETRMTGSRDTPPATQPVPQELLLAFAPVDKSAFGAAVAVAVALLLLLVTAIPLLRHQEGMLRLDLLASYFQGYSVSWPGAMIGAFWGGVAGFVSGWFAAFVRNLVVAISLFAIRTRAELAETRDFLDHV